MYQFVKVNRWSRLVTATTLMLLLLVLFLGFPMQSNAAATSTQIRVLVGFISPVTASDRSVIENVDGTLRHSFELIPAVSAFVSESSINGLLHNPRVAYVEYDGTLSAADMELDNTWGVQKIGGGTVQATGVTGAGVKVAVIDSGIDYTHSEFATSYAGGYDFVNEDSDPMDDLGHGTHVSGTIAAADNDSGVVGVAPDVELYALKVLDAQNFAYWSDVVRALEWSVNNGIQITNTSLVGNQGSKSMQAAYDAATAAGLFNAVSAGNNGECIPRKGTITYPAKYDSVVAVGAVDSSDTRPCFSSTGNELDIVAPGVFINSTVIGGGYSSTWSGTSMASPHVAGAAALLISAGISDENGNGLVNDDIRNILENTSVDPGAAGFDTAYGNGRVDVAAAVTSLTSSGTTTEPGTITATVSDVTYTTQGGKNGDRNVAVTATLQDEGGVPVSGVSVTTEITLDGAPYLAAIVMTDTNGQGSATISNAPSGCYAATVIGVDGANVVWDGLTPANGFCK